MKKLSADIHGDYETYADIGSAVYMADEVDARVEELETALRDVLEMADGRGTFRAIREIINKALGL